MTFVHTHTGESLTAPYAEAGAYQPVWLAKINYLLRDFRTGEIQPIDPALLDVLFNLQVRADREAPYEVISAYRSPATNQALHRKSDGVATRSLHMAGKAIDIRLSGFSTARLREHALALRSGGVGYYPSSDFIHVDTGRIRCW